MGLGVRFLTMIELGSVGTFGAFVGFDKCTGRLLESYKVLHGKDL